MLVGGLFEAGVGSRAVVGLLGWFVRLVAARVVLLVMSGDRRDAEILALRHQVLVLQRQIKRARFTNTDRAVLAVLSRAIGRDRIGRVMLIVKPATVLGWHRRLVARHWTHRSPRAGRPSTRAELRALVLGLAGENPTWGYRRIHGEMCRLGHSIAASTVWKILRNAGRDPELAENTSSPVGGLFLRADQAHLAAWGTDTPMSMRFRCLLVVVAS